MKKLICLLLAVCMLFALAACGGNDEKPDNPPEENKEEIKEWSRQGYFTDGKEYTLSVNWMTDIDVPGWYVGCLIGEDFVEDSYGGTLEQDGNTLRGKLSSLGSKGDITVTVSEEGEDGLALAVDGGETYHFKLMDLPEATIFVSINVEGWGNIDYAEGETAPEIDPEYPYQSAVINLAEPATHTFVAWPDAGNLFVKWTKNGEDFSTEPQITVLLDESADYVAVFEEDPDWQNPTIAVAGQYQCDRARALVECFGSDEAWITIDWANSAAELTRWIIVGRIDADTNTIKYSDGSKSVVVYDENGDITSEERDESEHSGTVVFNDDGTFTWHEDQSESGKDLVFEPVPVGPDSEPVPAEERVGYEGRWADEIAGRCMIVFTNSGEGREDVSIAWSSSAWQRQCWEMTANVYKDDIMIYEDGHSWVESYTDDSSFTVSDETFDETGSFFLEDGKLHWVKDQTGEETVFIPV